MFKKVLCSSIMLALVFLVGCGGPKEVAIEIKPLGNQMKYETTRFEVKSGQKVSLTFNNTATAAAMKHNVVILTDKTAVQAIGVAAITAKDHLPEHPAILIATPIVDPGKSATITFTAPSKKGEYTYICTYPGHYAMMQGVMIVK
ncbi:MAG: plastocyanin/azurin family copper-binding protein [bacterium]